jgi:hypothetical protein
LQWVRERLDEHEPHRPLLCLADGSYDRPAFWTALPDGTTALVRTASRAMW